MLLHITTVVLRLSICFYVSGLWELFFEALMHPIWRLLDLDVLEGIDPGALVLEALEYDGEDPTGYGFFTAVGCQRFRLHLGSVYPVTLFELSNGEAVAVACILEMLRQGETRESLADKVGVSRRTIYNLLEGKGVRSQTLMDVFDQLGIRLIAQLPPLDVFDAIAVQRRNALDALRKRKTRKINA